ncbi:uncharacterized protein [Symphalangus syndactylus]|uniref:uncharacterized protein n=1 Tax=Symphalangus syndactylus TaxID=9590 RepID=UPI003006F595
MARATSGSTSGARLALANPGVNRARPPSFWANRDKPPHFPAVYSPRQTLTNTVRCVAFAPAYPLIDVSLDPIEGSSLFLVSQEDFCSLSPSGYLCWTHKRALPELRQLHFLLSLSPAKKVKGGERRECLTGSRRFQSACRAKSGLNRGAPGALEGLSDPAAPSPAGFPRLPAAGGRTPPAQGRGGHSLGPGSARHPWSARRTGLHFLGSVWEKAWGPCHGRVWEPRVRIPAPTLLPDRKPPERLTPSALGLGFSTSETVMGIA